jgi:hypothetical protein
VAKGLPNKCISAVLEISTWTVATHLRRVFAKLGVSSRAAMIARVLEVGNANSKVTSGITLANLSTEPKTSDLTCCCPEARQAETRHSPEDERVEQAS